MNFSIYFAYGYLKENNVFDNILKNNSFMKRSLVKAVKKYISDDGS